MVVFFIHYEEILLIVVVTKIEHLSNRKHLSMKRLYIWVLSKYFPHAMNLTKINEQLFKLSRNFV